MTRRPSSWDENALKKLSDEDFIEVFAVAFADRTDLQVGALELHNPVKHGAPPEAIDLLLQEALHRGIPLETLTDKIVSQAKDGHSFISNLLAPPQWRRYEIQCAQLIINMIGGREKLKWQFDARVRGVNTRAERQVDFLVRRHDPLQVIACEFRHYPRRKVSMSHVEAFVTKLADVSADKGIIVTARGYQRGAIASAEHYGIDLFRLREMPRERVLQEYPNSQLSGETEEQYWVFERGESLICICSGDLTEKPLG